jgi:AraC family transcriptional regulator, glycine betaine-responsive activator
MAEREFAPRNPGQQTGPQNLGFLLFDQFSIMSVIAFIEPLRSTNRVLGYDAFRWSYCSLDGGPVASSSGLAIDTMPLEATAPGLDYLFICAGLEIDPPQRSRFNATLHRISRSGVRLGAVSAGTFVLAQAGLIRDRRCTVHWEFLPTFRETYPDINVEENLFVIDRDLYTSSGGMAGADLVLELISRRHGEATAQAVANQFNLDRVRSARESQRDGSMARISTYPALLQSAIRLMLAHVETPLAIREICRQLNSQQRQIERLFEKWVGCPPRQFYRRVRLEKAMGLLMHSNLTITEIAQMTGFTANTRFSQAFRREYARTPSSVRQLDHVPEKISG